MERIVKRLESSKYAFEMTLNRFTDSYKEIIKDNKIVPIRITKIKLSTIILPGFANNQSINLCFIVLRTSISLPLPSLSKHHINTFFYIPLAYYHQHALSYHLTELLFCHLMK